MATSLRKVDHTGLKTGMAITIVLLIAAFVLNSTVLVAIVAMCQLIGAAALPFAPYRLIYQYIPKFPNNFYQAGLLVRVRRKNKARFQIAVR